MSSQNQSNVDFRLHPLFRDMPSQPSFCPAIWGDEDAPPLDWLVEGCFIRGTVALLSSDGGLGKSLLMQQLCTAAATGQNWLGLATKRLRSWAMFCEDDEAELHRRQVRINAHYGCRMGDLEDVTYRTRAGHASTFVDFAKWDARPMMTELFSSSLGAAKKFGAQLIILDTASDIFGGNEIARDQVRAFITLLRRWAILADGCVILTAHVSNEGLSSGSGLSGSRAWSNSVRSTRRTPHRIR